MTMRTNVGMGVLVRGSQDVTDATGADIGMSVAVIAYVCLRMCLL